MGASNEHFRNQVSLLGVTQLVHPTRDQSFLQNYADGHWMHITARANQTISEQGAKDLVEEALTPKDTEYASRFDIPGINSTRNLFNPQKQVHVTDDLPEGVAGHLNTDMLNRQKMFLKHTDDEPLRVGVVTHETSHLLTHPILSDLQWANFSNANGIGHSWAMARMHVHVVRQTLGNKAADNLRSVYRAHGVSFGKTKI